MVVVEMEHHLAFGAAPLLEYPIITGAHHHGAFGRADRGPFAGAKVPHTDDTNLEHAKNAAAAAAVAAAAVDTADVVAAESLTSKAHGSPPTIGSTASPSKHNDGRRKALREANRIHCRETRERKRQRERMLLEVSTRH